MTDFLTVTLNTAIDSAIRINHIYPDSVADGEFQRRVPAGKGVNTARAIRNLVEYTADTSRVTSAGFVGESNKDFFREELERADITPLFVSVAGCTRENISLIHPEAGMHIRTNGYTVSDAAWQTLLHELSKQGGDKTVVLNGSIPDGITPEQVGSLAHKLNREGTTLVCDTAPEAYDHLLSAKPALIKPNEQELQSWHGQAIDRWRTLSEILHPIRAQGTDILLSLGENGVVLFTGDEILGGRCPVAPEHIVNTVGCGDTLLAAYVFFHQKGHSADKCLTEALATAAANCLTPSAGDFRQADIDFYRQRVCFYSLEELPEIWEYKQRI